MQKEPLTIPHTSVEVAKYFHRVTDTRETKDWSRHNELTLIAEHTKGEGIPIVFYSFSMLDEDIEDGSFKRLLTDLINLAFSEDCPENYAIKDYLDFYTFSHLRPHRNEGPSWHLEHEEYVQGLREWGKIFDECWNSIYEKFPNKTPITVGCDITSWGKGNTGEVGDHNYFNLANASSSNNDEDFASWGVYTLKEQKFFY